MSWREGACSSWLEGGMLELAAGGLTRGGVAVCGRAVAQPGDTEEGEGEHNDHDK